MWNEECKYRTQHISTKSIKTLSRKVGSGFFAMLLHMRAGGRRVAVHKLLKSWRKLLLPNTPIMPRFKTSDFLSIVTMGLKINLK